MAQMPEEDQAGAGEFLAAPPLETWEDSVKGAKASHQERYAHGANWPELIAVDRVEAAVLPEHLACGEPADSRNDRQRDRSLTSIVQQGRESVRLQ